VVYSTGIQLGNKGDFILLSSTEVMRRLGITKVTLYKWVSLRKVKCRRYQIGGRAYNGFDEKEIARLEKVVSRKWKRGHSKLG